MRVFLQASYDSQRVTMNLPTVNNISTAELVPVVQNNSAHIVDVRTIDAYNGWALNHEHRGGHIKGARALPLKWSNYSEWIDIVRHKNIFPRDELIVYGNCKEDAERIANQFIDFGYKDVSVYNAFLDEWTPCPELPMDRLERFRNLVPAEWVQQLILGKNPLHYDNDRFLVVHAHYRNRAAYLTGHIPGAIDMDTLELEAGDTWNSRSPTELKSALERHGITSDTTVILYGKFMHPDRQDPFPGSAAGDIGAMRCAFLMLYAGVKDVRVLNGGFQSWIDEGHQISFHDEERPLVVEFGSQIPGRPELAVDTSRAKTMLRSEDSELVCVRSWSEYIGAVSGYDFIERRGRIPGAAFADCGSDPYHMENCRNVDQTTREFHEVREIWAKKGITPDKHIAFYCGTGWRGSEAWFNAWLMGWPKVSVYDGGWFEWSNDADNPFEIGIPGEMTGKFRDMCSELPTTP